jgi:hypothetical protein
MPTYNTPDARNIYVGTGEVWFDRFDPSTGLSTGYRHLGNVSKLEITPSVTTIEKKSSMNAARAILARAITETKMEVALTLDEFQKDNVALALLGESSAFTQSSATKTGAALGNAQLGKWLSTGFNKITVTDVKHSSTTYVENTDYQVDSDSGMIFIMPTGTIVDGDALTWDGSVPAIASYQVQGLSDGNIIGALRFRSSADAIGPRKLIDIWSCAMSPDGALALIGDDFGEIGLKGEILPDSTKPAGQQFCRVIDL